MQSYQPLPEELSLAVSEIHGYGVHATEDIPASVVLGVTHIEDDSGNFHCNLIRTALGAYLNHSDQENCVLVKEGKYYKLVTLVPILRGEELVLNYHKNACGTYVTNFK